MIRFGLKIGPGRLDFLCLKKIWREAERLGYDSAWLYDHFYPVGGKSDTSFECWTTLTTLAANTESIRLGTMALCNLFRHPSVLARMASTLDILSNGRLELGIGAGWYEEEFHDFGITFPSVHERVMRLAESLIVIKKLWTEEYATFNGRYYVLRNAYCSPKPLQKPHPRLWVGIRKGRKMMPKIVSEQADAVNVTSCDVDRCRQILMKVEEACREIGRSYDSLLKSWQGVIIFSENSRELEAELTAQAKSRGIPVKQYREQQEASGAIIGDSASCVKKLSQYIDLGITYFILIFPNVAGIESIRLVAEKVMPQLRNKA